MARDLALEKVWRDRIERQQRSGLRIPAFCRQHGIVAQQFYWWRRELERRVSKTARAKGKSLRDKKAKQTAAGDLPRFLPVRMAIASQSSSSIEIVVDRPLRIALGHGFDPQALVELLRVLETRPC